MKDIVIYGCGGMGREIAWLIEEINKFKAEWNIIGYVDDNPNNVGRTFYNYPVIGGIEWLEKNKNVNCVIAIGNGETRKAIVEKINEYCIFPTLVHPNVSLNKSVTIREGSMVSSNVIFTTDIYIGEHVFINVNTCIMHDVKIGKYSTVFLGANIAGGVEIEECVEIGSGATIIPYKKIGPNTTVGAGSVVVKDILGNCTVVGVPAKPISLMSKH